MKTSIPLTFRWKGLWIFAIAILFTIKSYAQPANDGCGAATSLTIGAAAINGTLISATASAGIPVNCGNASSPDTWYSFVATAPYPTITLSAVGANLTTATPIIQIFSGTCAAPVSLGCVSGTTLSVPSVIGGAGLTVGSTYRVRIYTSALSAVVNSGTYTYKIAVANPAATTPTVDYGKSYVNITKGTNGGTTEPGDVLEIRATFVVKANTAYNCSFTDIIPANTTYIPGTLRILTNEGKIYQQFTDASDADGGTIAGTAVTINMGTGSNATNGGFVVNTSKPSFYNSACIMVASYQVTVGAALAYGTTLPVGFGTIKYSNNSGTQTTKIFPADTIVLYKNYGICSNTVGTNAITSESGGTFGSGNLKDRVPSSKVPANYTYAAFSNSAGMPGDYYYGISNNTSGGTTALTGYSILNNYPYPTNPQRIFGVWDIIGDHTGAASPTLGNPATDDNAGAIGGYMVVINASYRTDTAFLDTISNLCPNTYYQYAAWFRNICSKCGCDSNGKGATGGAGYIPTAAGDSSGVHPNLTFNINGYDYYTTGNMLYTGQWIQKGFTYQTGPSQTSMVINIRNNAPGGGGNDWAIDDIGVATCSPSIALTPDKPDTLCQGADDTVRFKVSSFFSNYTEWMLEKSVDGGLTWTSPGTDTTGAASTGSSVPVFNGTTNQYEYLVTRYYRLASDTLTTYRITIASTVANLSNGNCATANTTHKLVYGVNCMLVLPTNIVSFKGTSKSGYADLQWITANESGNITYSIERSDDQVHFESIGSIPAEDLPGGGGNYHFTDSKPLGAATYYRIELINNKFNKYSPIVLMSNTAIDFDVRSVTNPFTDQLAFDLTAPEDDVASILLIDMYGRVVKEIKQNVYHGLNNIRIYDLANLSEGTYALHVQYANKVINKRVIKLTK